MTLFQSFLSRPACRDIFSDRSVLAAMLRVEAALARAQAEQGVIPADAARAIAAHCDVSRYDVAAIAAGAAGAGSVAIPLIQALRQAVQAHDEGAARYTHAASTSQDIADTALALLTREALALMAADLRRAILAGLALAQAHAHTPALARTLMQPASVTSFGFKCLGWTAPLVRADARLRHAAEQALQLQLGGPVGTLANMDGKGQAVAASMARALGLRDPGLSWHTQRDAWNGLGCELGILAGSLGKIGRDLALAGQFEVAEAFEPAAPGRGASSAMSHKRNPASCLTAIAAAARAPQLVASLLSAMPQENERALGLWQAEQADWPALVMTVQGSLAAMADALEGLVVDEARMRRNIQQLCDAVPDDVAREWFRADLAEGIAAGTLHHVGVLRREFERNRAS
ncbi:3-carboxy-cis,cis-muconate cycloisomerase [Achromobacter sp. Marseille-Q0513]|uniref:lyase family protein n=1 Tax=Achromobacter sp. Marseille-Q0513 TaxID=2829161 RepID=UPI001B9CDC72|nr:lyase family protein [Achromobacter sp. Marseille-Q0513]MBR8655131.1 3-carboxy-cis,cis-muconate cycloisomerase [Achromobacter sp. Marseille-Q0513]